MILKRTIGTWGLFMAAFGGILGSGWLFGPYFAAKIAGPASIISWGIGGVLMIFIALTFAELSSTFPVAGGTVRFLQLSHGPLVSFTMAWIGWLSSAAVAPIETMALIHYAANYFPWLMHDTAKGIYVMTSQGILVAAIVMFFMCSLNVFGIRLLSKVNIVVVVFKFVIPLLTVGVLLSLDFHPSNLTSHGFWGDGWEGVLTSLPTAGVIFSFIGYSPAIQLAGEAKTPQRSVPIAIIGALLVGIVLYVLLEIAFVGSLPVSSFAHGWSQLSFKGDSGPFAGIAMAIGAVWLAMIVYAGALVAPFGTGLIYTASTARMTYAMGENGYLPNFLSKLNPYHVPARIIALNYLIGLLLFLPFPTWQRLVGFLVSCLVFAYAVGPLALLVLRKKMPNQPRPFKLPFPRVMCLFAFYICNLIIFWTGWNIIYKMLIAIAIGYVFLAVYKFTDQGRKLNLNWRRSWWIFIYLALMGVASYLGSFGQGLNVIHFGWDFAVIAVLTWVVFELAQLCAHYKGCNQEIEEFKKHM